MSSEVVDRQGVLDELRAVAAAWLDTAVAELPNPGGNAADDVVGLFMLADRFVEQFRSQVDVLIGDGRLNERDAANMLAACERVQRSVEATTAQVVSAAEAAGLERVDGHRSISGFIEASTRVSSTTAYHRMRTAELLASFPQLERLLSAGVIGIDQIRELGRLRSNRRITDADFSEVLGRLIDHATGGDYRSFRAAVGDWERATDVEGTRRSDDEVHEGRDVRLRTVGNTVFGEAQFGTAQGAQIRAVFDKFVEAEYQADWEEAKRRYGDAASVALLARTPAQRRADAFHAMVMAAASAPLNGKTVEPVVNIIVDQYTFETQLAELTGTEPPPAPFPTAPAATCRLDDGTPIDPRDAVMASVIGKVRRVVIGADGVIINLGRKRRCFTGSSRVAAMLQAGLDTRGRCAWSGCHSKHLQADHVAEWVADDGRTDIANVAPPCGFHNRWKSTGRYTARRDADGHWHTYRPDGSEIYAY